MPRIDERLVDGAPMLPLKCHSCSAAVRVRKASWHQTSIQWDAESMARCLERRENDTVGGDRRFQACEALRASVSEAALDGTIDVLEE